MEKLICEGGNDYIMPEELRSFWVAIGPLVLYVQRSGETEITVSMHPHFDEDDSSKDLWKQIFTYPDTNGGVK